MSEKVKAWTPNIYPHLVKTMDRHYTAGGIASDVQRNLERDIKTDNIASYAYKPQRSNQPKKVLTALRQPLQRADKQLITSAAHTKATRPHNAKSVLNRIHNQTHTDGN